MVTWDSGMDVDWLATQDSGAGVDQVVTRNSRAGMDLVTIGVIFVGGFTFPSEVSFSSASREHSVLIRIDMAGESSL